MAIIWKTVTGICLAAVALGVSADDTRSGRAGLPSPVSASSLSECVDKLGEQGGGWCSLGGSFFESDASPKSLDYYSDIRGWTGEKSIFIAWNGMAFDGRQKKLYFLANGGHADYLGNGVYEFDLAEGKWRRLRDPCRLSLEVKRDEEPPYGSISWNEKAESARIPDPLCGPASAHTYDGVQFASKTGTIFWVAGIYALAGGDRGGTFYSKKRLWEFNPSKSETRNGLEPLSWKQHDVSLQGWPASVELDNGWLLYGANSKRGVKFDPVDPAATVSTAPDMGNDFSDGNLVLDEQRDTLWFVSKRYGIMKIPLNGRGSRFAKKSTGFGMGAAMRNGKLVLWDGGYNVTEFDPETKKYTVTNWRGKKPGSNDKRVYSKWVYLPGEDVFVGIATGDAGVLVYKPPGKSGVAASTVNPQDFIVGAKAGESVTIPAGTYKKGIYIEKPLNLQMSGVRLSTPVHGKGAVVIDTQGPVVIDGLIADVPPECHTNCAGVRIQGRNYDVTLRNVTILNQEMGVLTGNEGGRLVIETSNIGDTGLNKQSDLSHVIYAGWSDELVIRDSKIHGSHRLGHLVKSRARSTVIERTQILGGHTRHSRLVETPCGGKLVIRDSVLQQSDKTDNPEFMMLGGASKSNCAGRSNWPVYLTMRNNRLVTYRDRSSDEPARNYGKTALMRYQGTNPPAVDKPDANIAFSNNTNETGADNDKAAIEVLWYGEGNRVSPLSIARLQGIND